MSRLLSLEDVESFRTDGFVVIRQAYSPERIDSLLAAVRRFLPSPLQQGSKKFVHLLADPAKFDPAFTAWLAEDAGPHLEALIEGGDIRHSLFNLLTAGGGEQYTQLWHRDFHPDQSKRSQDEAEWLHVRQALSRKIVQMNAPLLPGDDVLQVVPGSAARQATAAELAAAEQSWHDPMSVDMPGAIEVRLEPGDVVYYDNTILHRGHNPSGKARLTIHNAYWTAGLPTGSHDNGQQAEIAALLSQQSARLPRRAVKYLRGYLIAADLAEEKIRGAKDSIWWVEDGRGGTVASPWVKEVLLGQAAGNSKL